MDARGTEVSGNNDHVCAPPLTDSTRGRQRSRATRIETPHKPCRFNFEAGTHLLQNRPWMELVGETASP